MQLVFGYDGKLTTNGRIVQLEPTDCLTEAWNVNGLQN